jgi:hypothetical protein
VSSRVSQSQAIDTSGEGKVGSVRAETLPFADPRAMVGWARCSKSDVRHLISDVRPGVTGGFRLAGARDAVVYAWSDVRRRNQTSDSSEQPKPPRATRAHNGRAPYPSAAANSSTISLTGRMSLIAPTLFPACQYSLAPADVSEECLSRRWDVAA